MSLEEDIKLVDDTMNTEHAGSAVRIAWRRIRSKIGQANRISASTLPAAGLAAQHAVAACDHAPSTLDALGNITSGRTNEEET